jgi:hypothetical protein
MMKYYWNQYSEHFYSYGFSSYISDIAVWVTNQSLIDSNIYPDKWYIIIRNPVSDAQSLWVRLEDISFPTLEVAQAEVEKAYA